MKNKQIKKTKAKKSPLVCVYIIESDGMFINHLEEEEEANSIIVE